MATLRKVVLVGHVWLTAVAVCAAGLPHFHCRCPQAPTAPPAPGVILTNTPNTCCCGGECCRPDEETSCCLKHQGASPDEPNGAELPAAPDGCTGTLSPPDTLAPSPARTTVSADATPAGLLPPPAIAALLLAVAPTTHAFWEADRQPPPADRVITFRHLLI
jgi:hypothetical protein